MTAADTTASTTVAPVFTGEHHCWTVRRRARTFVVRVIEPAAYKPVDHAELFQAVMSELVSPAPAVVDPLTAAEVVTPAEPFDLATFPEAFVAAADLVDALEALAGAALPGCFHIGLRPTSDPTQHLFGKEEILALVDALAALPQTEAGDLQGFRDWASAQATKDHFNLGCLFTTDVDDRLRICLHPKLVRSKFEVHQVQEHLMAEATRLTLVTLRPANKTFFSVTLQPLLCSDALSLPTDTKAPPPLDAVNVHAACFGEAPPDHVDIVTVATCTPQTPISVTGGGEHRAWHEQFLDTFKRAASDPQRTRHHQAAFVLSNFLDVGGPGGLSGVFLPVGADLGGFPAQVLASAFGSPQATSEAPHPGPNRWSTPNDGAAALARWRARGVVAALTPFAPLDAEVRIFGFTIHRLPRDNSRWDTPAGLIGLEIQTGSRATSGEIRFEREVLRLDS